MRCNSSAFRVNIWEVLLSQEMQIPRQQEVIFRLACRPARNLQETAHLTIGSSAAAFGDVRSN
jgi:hypothetical protein